MTLGLLPPPGSQRRPAAAEPFSDPSPHFSMPVIGELRMCFQARRAPQRSLMSVAACLFLVAAFQGCTGNGSQADRNAEQQAKETGVRQEDLAKLVGRVTVDGQSPAEGMSLLVILNDPEHLDATANGKKPKLFTVCGDQGEFAIVTKPGKYIVTFVELHQVEARLGAKPAGGGRGPGGRMRRGDLRPPDELKNLYNDPDKNAKEEKFKLDLKLTGQEDYQIDLALAGKEPVETPGPHAVTQLTVR
jgi:hypothetical protein